jgi:hypothetical protein
MGSVALTKQDILKALENISDELARQNIQGELCLFGGTVMVLAFAARAATKDVDAIFFPTPIIRKIAEDVGNQTGLPSGWLNGGVKGFISAKHEAIEGNLPQFPNLRLTMPTPEYLLAMKCLASRIDVGDAQGGDVSDIIFLIRYLKLSSVDAVMAVVLQYYPPGKIPLKAQYLVEGLFEEEEI